MNAPASERDRMFCAAYGCPLFGTLGSDGRWWCVCHFGRPASFNDAITAVLHSDACAPVVASTLDIRRAYGSFFDLPDVYRSIQKRLLDAGRADLLMSADERHSGGVRAWLMRLERVLIDATARVGTTHRLMATVPTASIIGPTRSVAYLEHAKDEE